MADSEDSKSAATTPMRQERGQVTVDSHALETLRIHPAGEHEPGAPTLVFLHEGVGSVSLWRDFPLQVCARTGLSGLVYSRYGYGQSVVLAAARDPRYMHHEGQVVLPQLLAKLDISAPHLLGHSDGGSIALIHAGSAYPVRSLTLLAPHVFVETISIAGIEEAREVFNRSDELATRLARHHRDPVATFRGWNDIWLHPDFRNWNIENLLPAISAPVLLIQGEDDHYGTMAQLDAIERQVSGPCRQLRLADCGHNPHRDQASATLQAIGEFLQDNAARPA